MLYIRFILIIAFIFNSLGITSVKAQDLVLPKPGVMVRLSPPLNPPVLKAIKVYTDNPFRFDFVLDKGDSNQSQVELRQESNKLIKYFLASLTIPERDLWVNLSPYEKDRIIPTSFGVTEMGRDLLAEDYLLKQITASLIYPEGEIGKKFWKRIYEEAQKKYGNTNIPVNTFNKVWIVPEKAVVYENAKAGTAYVVESKLKVMLEQDYLSLQKHSDALPSANRNETALIGANIVREIVIPELTKEVNEGKNFAQLRQVYNSLILATWYKKKIKDSILSKVYADRSKTQGVNIDDPQEKEKIYQQYLKAFKKGVYNYIKEEIDPVSNEKLPRKYFSGGVSCTSLDIPNGAMKVVESVASETLQAADLSVSRRQFLTVGASILAGIISPETKAATPEKPRKTSVEIKAEVFEQLERDGISKKFYDGKYEQWKHDFPELGTRSNSTIGVTTAQTNVSGLMSSSVNFFGGIQTIDLEVLFHEMTHAYQSHGKIDNNGLLFALYDLKQALLEDNDPDALFNFHRLIELLRKNYLISAIIEEFIAGRITAQEAQEQYEQITKANEDKQMNSQSRLQIDKRETDILRSLRAKDAFQIASDPKRNGQRIKEEKDYEDQIGKVRINSDFMHILPKLNFNEMTKEQILEVQKDFLSPDESVADELFAWVNGKLAGEPNSKTKFPRINQRIEGIKEVDRLAQKFADAVLTRLPKTRAFLKGYNKKNGIFMPPFLASSSSAAMLGDNPLTALTQYDGKLRDFIEGLLGTRYSYWNLKPQLAHEILDALLEYPQDPQRARANVYAKVIEFERSVEWNEGYQRYKEEFKYESTYSLIEPRIGHLTPGSVVVDWGAGNNDLGNAIINNNPGVKVIGIDVLEYGKQKTGNGLEYRHQTDPTKAPDVPDHSVDVVTMNATLHHIDDPLVPAVLKEIKRILRPSGKLILIEDTYSRTIDFDHDPTKVDIENTRTFLSLVDKYGDQFARDYFTFNDWYSNIVVHNWDGMALPYKFRSIEEWQKLLEGAGFTSGFVRHTGFPAKGFHKPDLGVLEFVSPAMAESKTNLFELKPTTLDLRNIIPREYWGKPIRIVLVADNSGTFTLNFDQPMDRKIADGVIQLLDRQPNNYLVVNTGDSREAIQSSHRAIIEAARDKGFASRYFATWNGGTSSGLLSTDGNIERTTHVEDWSAEKRRVLISHLAEVFYNKLIEMSKQGVEMSGLTLAQIQEDRQRALQNINDKYNLGKADQWLEGESKNVATYLFSDVHSKDSFIYDSGAKVALDLYGLSKKYPFMNLAFCKQLEKDFKAEAGIAEGDASIRSFAGDHFIDVVAVAKVDAVNDIIANHIPSSDEMVTLFVSVGDSGNDIPTMQHRFGTGKANEITIPIFLHHDQGFADVLTGNAYVSKGQQILGTREAVDWLNKISGKTVNDGLATMDLLSWQSSSFAMAPRENKVASRAMRISHENEVRRLIESDDLYQIGKRGNTFFSVYEVRDPKSPLFGYVIKVPNSNVTEDKFLFMKNNMNGLVADFNTVSDVTIDGEKKPFIVIQKKLKIFNDLHRLAEQKEYLLPSGVKVNLVELEKKLVEEMVARGIFYGDEMISENLGLDEVTGKLYLVDFGDAEFLPVSAKGDVFKPFNKDHIFRKNLNKWLFYRDEIEGDYFDQIGVADNDTLYELWATRSSENKPVGDVNIFSRAMTSAQTATFTTKELVNGFNEHYNFVWSSDEYLALLKNPTNKWTGEDEEGYRYFKTENGEGDTLVEVSKTGTRRYLNKDGRWLLELAPSGDKTVQCLWTNDGKHLLELEYLSLNGQKVLVEERKNEKRKIDVKKSRDGIVFDSIVYTYTSGLGVDFIHEGVIPGGERNLNVRAPEGYGLMLLNIMAKFARDQREQNKKLRFYGGRQDNKDFFLVLRDVVQKEEGRASSLDAFNAKINDPYTPKPLDLIVNHQDGIYLAVDIQKEMPFRVFYDDNPGVRQIRQFILKSRIIPAGSSESYVKRSPRVDGWVIVRDGNELVTIDLKGNIIPNQTMNEHATNNAAMSLPTDVELDHEIALLDPKLLTLAVQSIVHGDQVFDLNPRDALFRLIGTHEFWASDFNKDLEKIESLLEKLGQPKGTFKDFYSALDWLNDSIEPFKIGNNEYSSLSDEGLRELVRTYVGQKRKREILRNKFVNLVRKVLISKPKLEGKIEDSVRFEMSETLASYYKSWDLLDRIRKDKKKYTKEAWIQALNKQEIDLYKNLRRMQVAIPVFIEKLTAANNIQQDDVLKDSINYFTLMLEKIEGRISFAKGEMKKEEFPLSNVVDALKKKSRSFVEIKALKKQGDEFVEMNDAGLSNITLDGEGLSLTSAFYNIIHNAEQKLQADDNPESKVEVQFIVTDGQLKIIISDNAGGIPEKIEEGVVDKGLLGIDPATNREKLFSIGQTEGKETGTGYGLAEALQVAKFFGGDLTVANIGDPKNPTGLKFESTIRIKSQTSAAMSNESFSKRFIENTRDLPIGKSIKNVTATGVVKDQESLNINLAIELHTGQTVNVITKVNLKEGVIGALSIMEGRDSRLVSMFPRQMIALILFTLNQFYNEQPDSSVKRNLQFFHSPIDAAFPLKSETFFKGLFAEWSTNPEANDFEVSQGRMRSDISNFDWSRVKNTIAEKPRSLPLNRLSRADIVDLMGPLWAELKGLVDRGDVQAVYKRDFKSQDVDRIIYPLRPQVTTLEFFRGYLNQNLRIAIAENTSEVKEVHIGYKYLDLVTFRVVKVDDDTIELKNIWLQQQIRNNGWGTKMLLSLLEYFRRFGFTKIKISPSDDSKDYWKKFGVGNQGEDSNLTNEIGIEQLMKSVQKNLEAKSAAMSNGFYFEGMDGLDEVGVRKKVFGDEIDKWLPANLLYGNKLVKGTTIDRLASNEKFISHLESVKNDDDIPIEIIRFILNENVGKEPDQILNLGTSALGEFLQLLRDSLFDKGKIELANRIPSYQIPLGKYIKIIVGIGLAQKYLDEDPKFQTADPNDKLRMLVRKMIEVVKDFDIKNLSQIYSALPNQLSSKVFKKDIVKVYLSLEQHDELRRVLDYPSMRAFIEKELMSVEMKNRLDRLIEELKGYIPDLTENRFAIYTDLPKPIRDLVNSPSKAMATDGEFSNEAKSAAMLASLFRSPSENSDKIPFKKIRLSNGEYTALIIKELKEFCLAENLDIDPEYLKKQAWGLTYLIENLFQHEYFWRYSSLYYRIYKTSTPSGDVSLELDVWGPAKHELPSQFIDQASNGDQFKWFDSLNRPWDTRLAPKAAVKEGEHHLGVSHMFDNLGDSIKVGWREDRKSKGHVVAVLFPIKKTSNQRLASTKLESSAMNINNNGGIDLTSNKFLETQNVGEGIKFHMDPAMLQQLQNAPGFYPVIINIQPMTDIRNFLGLNDVPAQTQLAQV